MKVVFREEVEGTARPGEVKNVADGFARNYLLPRRLAAPATAHYLNVAEAKAEKDARRQSRLDEEATQYVLPKVEGQALAIEARVGEQGKLFGSITARDIAEALQEATGVELEHRHVELRAPIRELGSRDVTVRLTRNVRAQISVNVEPLGGQPEAEATAPEAVEEDASTEPEAAESEPAEEAIAAEVETTAEESEGEPEEDGEEA
jgi:large subunit ribosomal protein L9